MCINIDSPRLDKESKWPDLFSRNEACKAYPESLRDAGVRGGCGKTGETGDIGGESVFSVLDVDAVLGRSPVPPRDRVFLACKKAFSTNPRLGLPAAAGAPKEVDVSPTNLLREVDWALGEKTEEFSEEKASPGKLSTTYGGGPVGTPNLW